MYENAQEELDRIIALAKKCPIDLQPKCFELLLQGYVESQVPRRSSSEKVPDPEQNKKKQDGKEDGAGGDSIKDVPEGIRTRFNALAGRAKATPAQLASLFDFSVDPFTFGAFTVEGKNTFEKARKVALLVAAKNYLVTGKWTADWDEMKAVCIDHNCYDNTNFSKVMKKAKGKQLKSVVNGKSVELSTQGTTDAHTLLNQLVTNAAK